MKQFLITVLEKGDENKIDDIAISSNELIAMVDHALITNGDSAFIVKDRDGISKRKVSNASKYISDFLKENGVASSSPEILEVF